MQKRSKVDPGGASLPGPYSPWITEFLIFQTEYIARVIIKLQISFKMLDMTLGSWHKNTVSLSNFSLWLQSLYKIGWIKSQISVIWGQARKKWSNVSGASLFLQKVQLWVTFLWLFKIPNLVKFTFNSKSIHFWIQRLRPVLKLS